MDIVGPEIHSYSESCTSPEPHLLRQINRETYARMMMPRMLSGHLQGRFLSMVSKMIQPGTILEIGTYTGYSAICLAEGLAPGGKIITMDINEELEERVRNYFQLSGLNESIDYHIGDALTIIPTLAGPFDLVWIDADKENYSAYFDLIIDRVAGGGIILADNVLWSGKVLEKEPDKETKAIQAFNAKIHDDTRVENLLLPIRDGIMVIRKI